MPLTPALSRKRERESCSAQEHSLFLSLPCKREGEPYSAQEHFLFLSLPCKREGGSHTAQEHSLSRLRERAGVRVFRRQAAFASARRCRV